MVSLAERRRGAEHLERDASAPGARTTVFEEQGRAMGREIQFLRYRKEA